MVRYNSEFLLLTQSKHARPRLFEALIHLSDEGIAEAREVLIRFRGKYSKLVSREKDLSQSEFGLVRKYEATGTGFSINDPIAPGSVVVEHLLSRGKVKDSYYYISPDRKGPYGEPIIYCLNNNELEKYGIYPPLRRLLSKSRLVYIENLEWTRKYGGDYQEQSQKIFTCREENSYTTTVSGQPDYDRYSFDIWVKGSHMPERVRQDTVTIHRPLNLVPVPTNI